MKSKRKTLQRMSGCLLFLITPLSFAGDYCGSKVGVLNTLAAQFLIPEQFPPETEVLKPIFSNNDCSGIGIAHLSYACIKHDDCYENREGKEKCDKDLLLRWVNACNDAYPFVSRKHIECNLSCVAFVNAMSSAQTYDRNGFCPSCESYNQ